MRRKTRLVKLLLAKLRCDLSPYIRYIKKNNVIIFIIVNAAVIFVLLTSTFYRLRKKKLSRVSY